jgi:hypothetical protein
MATKILLEKKYDGESVVDYERDVLEAIQDAETTKDEYGFAKGKYRILVEYTED